MQEYDSTFNAGQLTNVDLHASKVSSSRNISFSVTTKRLLGWVTIKHGGALTIIDGYNMKRTSKDGKVEVEEYIRNLFRQHYDEITSNT